MLPNMDIISSITSHLFIILVLQSCFIKSDPDPLQDYCITDPKRPKSFFLNGVPCINPSKVLPSHFATSALSKSANTTNQFGFAVTLTSTENLPGVNTQGLAMARIDIAVNGIVPPHSHPRASEVTTCLQGSILVGFVTTSNVLFSKTLQPGDSFVFPKGLVHFLYNVDKKVQALAVSGLSSQNPGAQLASLASFTSNPPIPTNVLMKAFQISNKDVARIRKNLGG